MIRLFLLLSVLAFPGEIRVSMKPLSIGSTTLSYGAGRDIGLWTTEVCNYGVSDARIARADIFLYAPEIRELSYADSIDTLSRKASRDPRSLLSRVFSLALPIAAGALSISGLQTGTSAATYSGLGLSAAMAVYEVFAKTRPAPMPSLSQILPEEIQLAPRGEHGYCGTWIVVSSLIKEPKVQTFIIE